MKKLFITSLFALLCTTSHAHAWYEAYTQTTSSNNIKTDISVTATMAVADITITVTNPNKIPIENSLRVYSDILPSGGCGTSILNKPIEMDGATSTYTHTFRLSNLVPNKQYCFQYSGWPPKLFKTDPITTPTGNFFKWPLNVTDPTGQTVVLSGKIDITKYANLSELEVQFYYSKLPFSSTTNPPDTKWLNAHTSLVAGSGEGVAPDGSYYRKIDQLTPKAKYYYKQVIVVKGTTTVLATNFDATATFNSTDGYVPAGSAQEKTLEDAKTYNLLAPWPGLSKLMDPDLCAQQKIDGKLPKGAVCDINGFLNFAFKMLIGLTAVVLVLRLMYEGYQYIVTDVPFLKASAKSGFFTALYGLLLALSAYLILNTINPKLVSNTFNVANVSVGVEDRLAIAFSKYTQTTGGPLSPDDIKKMRAQYGKAWDAVKTTYIPARDVSVPTASKGAKLLMTAQTTVEGFYPNTKSWRTNNPGNVGNTDNGAVASFPTLDAGIKKQYEHLTRIVNGQNPAYRIGRVVNIGPVTDVATNITYPGINFTFDGSLHQYLKIYATGARKDNNYLSYVIAFFEKEGIKIDGYTKIADIYKMK